MTTYNWILSKIINRNNGGGGSSETPTTTDLCIAYAKTHDNQMFTVIDTTENAAEPTLYYIINSSEHRTVVDHMSSMFHGIVDSFDWEARIGTTTVMESTDGYLCEDVFVSDVNQFLTQYPNQWPVIYVTNIDYAPEPK